MESNMIIFQDHIASVGHFNTLNTGPPLACEAFTAVQLS